MIVFMTVITVIAMVADRPRGVVVFTHLWYS